MSDYELPAEVRELADRLTAEVGAERAALDPAAFHLIDLTFASTAALERSWEHGKMAAKIRWGTDGAMKRCIHLVREHTSMLDPGGYCATRHKHATGQWPTEGGKAGIPS
jgi:hypothetical protein